MSELLTLILLGALLYYLWQAFHAKEKAIRACRLACERAGVQFLDDTVEQRKVRLRRGKNGAMTFCRYYVFEFSVQGDKRYEGRAIQMGEDIVALDMDAYRLPDNVVRMPH